MAGPSKSQTPEKIKTDDDRINFCLEWIRRVRKDHVEGAVDSDRAEALRYYDAKGIGIEIEGRSQVTTTDLQDTIEWVLPSLMKVFAGGEDVCSLQPRGEEDVEAANLHQELVNYQMRVRNTWFVTIHDFIKDAMLFKFGCLKYQWHTERTPVKKSYSGLNEMELAALLQQPGAELVNAEGKTETASDPMTGIPMESPPIYSATIQTWIEDEFPLIDAVPIEEVFFPLKLRSMDRCPFFAHRVSLYPWEIRKRYGSEVMGKLEDWKNAVGPAPENSLLDMERWNDLGGDTFFSLSEEDKYWVYECYYPDPETGDPVVTHICGEVILERGENKYGKPPFILGTPIKMSHRVIGRSFHDLVRELQKMRTVLMRMVMDSVYFSNYGRAVIDENRVNLDDYLNQNRPGGTIRGDPSGIAILQTSPLQGWVFSLLESIQAERENRTGVTRYNQGMDAKSLNKTARGINAILSQSAQRIEMVARMLAEMAISPLIQAVIDMNTKFMTRKTAIRVLNEWTEIQPDNVVGRFDVVVNVGIGTGNKDQVIAQMQQLLGLFAQIGKAGVPIVLPKNVYHAMSELIKAMGYRNVKDFLTDPDQAQVMMKAVKALEGCMMDISRITGAQPPPQVIQILQAAQQALGMTANLQGVEGEGMANPASQPEMAMGPMPAMAIGQ